MPLIMNKESYAKSKGLTTEELDKQIENNSFVSNGNTPCFEIDKLVFRLAKEILNKAVSFALNEFNPMMIPQLSDLVGKQPGANLLSRITVSMVRKIIGGMVENKSDEEKAEEALRDKIRKDLEDLKNGNYKEKIYELPNINSKFSFSVMPTGNINIDVNKLKNGCIFPFETFKIGGFDMPKFTFGLQFTIRF